MDKHIKLHIHIENFMVITNNCFLKFTLTCHQCTQINHYHIKFKGNFM